MIEAILKKVAQNLDKCNIPYMIIGGQAVLIYGTPRLTRDIDITLGADSDQFAVLEKVCNQSDLKILPENPQDFANETKVLPAEDSDSKIRIDFIFSFTIYENQAFKRTKKILIGDYPVKFASCEDVLIHKMVAGRAIDAEDVKNILIKNRKNVDFDYINRWLNEFGKIDEYSDIVQKFKNILEQIEK
jgi:predicted nucleotidyltransferase